MRKKQIMIVEDELIIAEDVKYSLISSGFEVFEVVATGSDSVRLAGELKPDVILMDILLEGDMSGIEAAQEIKRTSKVPIVFCTALTDEHTKKMAKLTDPHGYITKPFEESELQSALSDLFSNN